MCTAGFAHEKLICALVALRKSWVLFMRILLKEFMFSMGSCFILIGAKTKDIKKKKNIGRQSADNRPLEKTISKSCKFC